MCRALLENGDKKVCEHFKQKGEVWNVTNEDGNIKKLWL